jgi:hypothetical protein
MQQFASSNFWILSVFGKDFLKPDLRLTDLARDDLIIQAPSLLNQTGTVTFLVSSVNSSNPVTLNLADYLADSMCQNGVAFGLEPGSSLPAGVALSDLGVLSASSGPGQESGTTARITTRNGWCNTSILEVHVQVQVLQQIPP